MTTTSASSASSIPAQVKTAMLNGIGGTSAVHPAQSKPNPFSTAGINKDSEASTLIQIAGHEDRAARSATSTNQLDGVRADLDTLRGLNKLVPAGHDRDAVESAISAAGGDAMAGYAHVAEAAQQSLRKQWTTQ